jgi:MFS family permease
VDNKEVQQYPKVTPGFFHGYLIVIVAFFIMLVGYGLYMVFGIFFEPLITEFGWSKATTSGAFSLSMILSGVLGIVMGGLNDRFGSRILVSVCGFLTGLGFLLMSQVGSVWQMYLFTGVLIGVGIGGLWVPVLSTVARWFTARRSLMTGIVIAGTGIGGLIEPPLVSRLILAYGWRTAYIILGIIIILVTVIAAQFLRHPRQTGQLSQGENKEKKPELGLEIWGFSLKEAVCSRQFWLAWGMFFCLGYCLFAIMVHVVTHAIELGISPVSAANILAAMGGMSIVGNFALGTLGDRIGNRQVYIIGFIIMAAFLFLLVPARELWLFFLFAIFFGLAHGGMGASESPLVAWLFGLKSHGLIFGVLGLGFTAGAAVGPFFTGYIFDLTLSYKLAFLICAAVSVIGLILSAVLRPTKRQET